MLYEDELENFPFVDKPFSFYMLKAMGIIDVLDKVKLNFADPTQPK